MSDTESIAKMMAEGSPALPKWFCVGLTLDEWQQRARAESGLPDAFVIHEDTLVCTEDGRVWQFGILGAAWVGVKNSDGTVNRAPAFTGVVWPHGSNARIVEAADVGLERHGCSRLPSGAIDCRCPDDDW